MILGERHRTLLMFPSQTTPERVVKIQHQHLLGRAVLHAHIPQDQLCQALLRLIAEQDLTHIPHFHGEGIFLSQLLYHSPVWEFSHIGKFLAQGIQPVHPQILKCHSVCQQIRCLQLRAKKTDITHIINSLWPKRFRKGRVPLLHMGFHHIFLKLMLHQFRQIYDQKSDLWIKLIVVRIRVHHGAQLVSVARGLMHFRFPGKPSAHGTHIHIGKQGDTPLFNSSFHIYISSSFIHHKMHLLTTLSIIYPTFATIPTDT